MNLLLDTHIWLWTFLAPEKIHPKVAGEISSQENDLWLSPISVWEFLMLVRKNKLVIHGSIEQTLDKFLTTFSLKEAPLTFDVARELQHFEIPHNDPGDRFLVATARVYGLTLVTGDEKLSRTQGISVLANR